MKHTFMHTQSVVDHTLERIVDLIIATDLVKLPSQDVLAKQLNVSRPALREAVCKLQMLNIVTLKPKVGTTVNESSKWRLVNLNVAAWRVRAGDTEEQVKAEIELAI
jgi:DNA-binding FadR family transcriptional regulator